MKRILTFTLIAFALLATASCKKALRPAEVHGTVTYYDHDFAGVTVSLVGASGTYEYVSNSEGYYVIRDITPGEYTFTCSYNGKTVNFDLVNYEKAENPHDIIVEDNGYHVRNIVIDSNEDLGGGDDEDDDEE